MGICCHDNPHIFILMNCFVIDPQGPLIMLYRNFHYVASCCVHVYLYLHNDQWYGVHVWS